MILFVDSSALIALTVERDQYHNQAISFTKGLTSETRFVTSSFVLDETITHINSLQGPKIAYKFCELLLESPRHKIVEVDKAIFHQAMILLLKFNDKELSFTDLTSFVIMRMHKIRTAFCFDTDFIKVGFETVPFPHL